MRGRCPRAPGILSLYGQDSWTERRSDLRSALSESRHLSRRSSSIPGELCPPLRHDQHSVSMRNRYSPKLQTNFAGKSDALGRSITQRWRPSDRTASPQIASQPLPLVFEAIAYRRRMGDASATSAFAKSHRGGEIAVPKHVEKCLTPVTRKIICRNDAGEL
jgi:hypothetical protein